MSAGSDPRRREAASGRLPLPLVAHGLVKAYGSRTALAGVDLVLSRGEVAGVVGPNGSGKTTLLRVVAGLARADRGRAVVCGAPAGSLEARSSVAVVPDEPEGLDELTIAELAALGRALYRVPEAPWRDRLAVLVRAFGLEARIDARLGALSRGLRRQASMIAAFAVDARLTLVDEATATLDPEASAALRAIIRANAARGKATLLATQDLAFAERVCDCVILLQDGAVVEVGAPRDLSERYGCERLEDAFLEAVGRGALLTEAQRELAAL